MEDLILWLQLQLALGGTGTAGELLRGFRRARELFSAAPETLVKAGRVSPALGERLRSALRLEGKARTVAAQCRHFGWAVLTPEDPFFPAELKELPDPPLALYAAGDPQKLRAPDKAAVVGTRAPADAALKAAYDVGAALSLCGIVTVSGGALGVDTAAHEGALTGRGGTICVLGSGLGSAYLPEKVFLRRRIRNNGVLVSELPPFTPPTRNTFPRRNRLIAALGGALFMAASDAEGGSMITANYAQRLGRTIFVPAAGVFSTPGARLLAQRGARELASTGPLTAFFGFAEAEDWPLLSGGALPPVLTPAKISPETFASLNGVRLSEALPLYNEILARSYTAPPVPAPVEVPPIRPIPERASAALPAVRPPDAALKAQIAAAQGLSGDALAVFGALSSAPRSIDEVAAETGLPAADVCTALSVLELSDLAETLPGNQAALKI